MRPCGRGHTTDEDQLPHTSKIELVDQTRDRFRSIAQTMRLAAPVAVGPERHERRVETDWRRQRGGDHLEAVLAAEPGEVEHFGTPIATIARRQKAPAIRLA